MDSSTRTQAPREVSSTVQAPEDLGIKATFTLICDGESKGNVRPVWAGQSDDELSDYGREQAKALGNWFVKEGKIFDTVYVSDLKRAQQTADEITKCAKIIPPLKIDASLREISFGEADGKPYVAELTPGLSLEDHFDQGIFPHIRNRIDRFPGGESKDDLARRAESVVQKLVIPIIEGTPNAHVAIVSHGVFLRELLYALHRRNGSLAEYKYLEPTAWTEMEIEIPQNSTVESVPINLDVKDINRREHLEGLVDK
ncbi:phosphoglycerate mutase-like protein [Dendrothele bispora CBS 962.96]|uniref:Phosphoglycerate mutase-like protein n=1 Tax=Dendrothele bispora (strain CBS 962.96) TaxID=1314807 RepID=A0A4S8MTA8_DENBC|nr:phosphoglycerate mutase-like protein [Dendrothele bispora CBS 962.96]